MKKGNIAVLITVLALLTSCWANTNSTTYETQETTTTTNEATPNIAENKNLDTNFEESTVDTSSDDFDLANGTITIEDFSSEGASEDITVSISTNTLVYRNEDVITDTILVNGNEIWGFQTEIGLNIEFVKIDGTNVEFIVDSSQGISNYVYDASSGTNIATLVSE